MFDFALTNTNVCSILNITGQKKDVRKNRWDVKKMKQILNAYYGNNGEKLRRMVDKILSQFGGIWDKDKDDFYSLANEVFADMLKRYDNTQSFDGFLYSCLSNRIKSEISRRNRYKRKSDVMCISIEACKEESAAFGEILAVESNIEKEIFEENGRPYSHKMLRYLERLSVLQKNVLFLIGEGYLPNEIIEKLQITEKQYTDCNAAIRAYRNVSLLF